MDGTSSSPLLLSSASGDLIQQQQQQGGVTTVAVRSRPRPKAFIPPPFYRQNTVGTLYTGGSLGSLSSSRHYYHQQQFSKIKRHLPPIPQSFGGIISASSGNLPLQVVN